MSFDLSLTLLNLVLTLETLIITRWRRLTCLVLAALTHSLRNFVSMAITEGPSITGTENLGLAMSLDTRIQLKGFDLDLVQLSIIPRRCVQVSLGRRLLQIDAAY